MRFKSINDAINKYHETEPDNKEVQLSDHLAENLNVEFDFHNENIDDDELFNKITVELVKNAYMTQLYSTKTTKGI